MAFLQKYNTPAGWFVLFLTFSSLLSCSSSKLYNSKIEGKKISITSDYKDDSKIEAFIAPYRNHINKNLDSVLAYCPETLDKSQGRWQTTIGNLLADVTFEKADKLLQQRENKHLDVCLLNHGGIRAIIPKGDVTTRTAYEIMPFENSLIITALKGTEIKEIAQYLIAGKKPHPLSGMQVYIDSNNNIKNITVKGKPVVDSQTYYVATSDYLYNGGDNMNFFKKSTATYDMDYKLRNLLIDYFKETDTLPVITTQRIITE